MNDISKSSNLMQKVTLFKVMFSKGWAIWTPCRDQVKKGFDAVSAFLCDLSLQA